MKASTLIGYYQKLLETDLDQGQTTGQSSRPDNKSINKVLPILRQNLLRGFEAADKEGSPLSSTNSPSVRKYWTNNETLQYVQFLASDCRIFQHIVVRESAGPRSPEGPVSQSKVKFAGFSYEMLRPAIRSGNKGYAVPSGISVFSVQIASTILKEKKGTATKPVQSPNIQSVEMPNDIFGIQKSYVLLRNKCKEILESSGYTFFESGSIKLPFIAGEKNMRDHDVGLRAIENVDYCVIEIDSVYHIMLFSQCLSDPMSDLMKEKINKILSAYK